MFIYWGKKAVRRYLGFAADFCPIERSFQPFSVFSIGVASHVYGVSLSSGQIIGYEIVCRKCSTTAPLRSLPYAMLSDKELSLSELISQTYPQIHDTYRSRLKLEEMIRQNPADLPRNARDVLIRESFEELDHDAGKIKADLYIDHTRGLVCAGILGIITISICMAVYMTEPYSTPAAWTAASFIFMGMVYALFLHATGPMKAFRKLVLPRLVRALSPLDPAKDELQSCFQNLKTMGARITGFMKPDEIHANIQSSRNHSSTGERVTRPAGKPECAMQFSFYDAGGRAQNKIFHRDDITIGSSRGCDLIFPELAPEHCRVYLSAQGYYAHDLAGGLIINRNTGSGFLNDNDVLFVGPASIRFNITP